MATSLSLAKRTKGVAANIELVLFDHIRVALALPPAQVQRAPHVATQDQADLAKFTHARSAAAKHRFTLCSDVPQAAAAGLQREAHGRDNAGTLALCNHGGGS